MATEFLRDYGLDVDQIIRSHGLPSGSSEAQLPLPIPEPVVTLRDVYLARSSKDRYDLTLDPRTKTITNISPSKTHPEHHDSPFAPDVAQCVALPSLCHPHVHLDKAYLLSHPLTYHLAPDSGDFSEALSVTSKAKKLYTRDSLLERGNWLIAGSVAAGVTHMRAFVEVDATVKHLCIDAGLELKRLWKGRCEIQLCAFAQDPVFSGDSADETRRLMEEAVTKNGVDVVGSTPYVESNDDAGVQNIEWAVNLAMKYEKHLDFHLDYFLDRSRKPLVRSVLSALSNWTVVNHNRTVCLGHCTRLTRFSRNEWDELAQAIAHQRLPVHFVGLPTSDTFMMARTTAGEEIQDRGRGTLQIPWLIEHLGLNASLSINNVGNAFTPQGSPDPLSLASMCVGLYQTGTAAQANLLYECVSSRARKAIGFGTGTGIDLQVGDHTDLIVFGKPVTSASPLYRRRVTAQETLYDAPSQRLVIFNSRHIKVQD